jgi:predicted  nucleic acid-binding Zn-ribbon protein
MTTETTESEIKPQPKHKDVKSSVDAKEPSTKKASATKKPSVKTLPKETPKAIEPTLASVSKELAALITKVSNLDQRMTAFEQQIIDANEAIKKLLDMGESTGKGTSKARGRIRGQKVLDTKTNKVYSSLSKAGKELAIEIKGDPTDRFIFYKIEKAFPGRFERVA